MKIYTRQGDDGRTGLLGPGRVLKSSTRVEAYGAVDELNALLGMVRARDAERWLERDLVVIQESLFSLGAELAAPDARAAERLVRIGDREIESLEATIDRLDAELPELTSFILPGGTPLAAELHLARTVCRRAERRVVALAEAEPLAPTIVRYLNRLADLLFVMARWSSHRAGVRDVEWHPPARA